MSSKVVTIKHFSDILCIWAYLGQIRIDKIRSEFGNEVSIEYHFCSVFGSVKYNVESNWQNKGGVEAYNKHVLSVASNYDHVKINPNIWVKNRPKSSASSHLVLKAIQIIDNKYGFSCDGQNNFVNYMWAVRQAFFRDCIDVSNIHNLLQLAEKFGYIKQEIEEYIYNGMALAEVEHDNQLKAEYKINGSPTLILNEGRQMLYGNVGYRVIEANIKELLNNPEHQASWC